MKLTAKKSIFMFVLILCIALTAIVMSSCTKQQREQAVETYGNANAYEIASSGVPYKAPASMNYYIGNLSGEYEQAARYAIQKANTLTNSVIVSREGTASSDYKFSTVQTSSSQPTANAYNSRSYYPNTGTIASSNIVFITSKLDSRNLTYKQHTALHEMGHSFGLGHIEDGSMRGYTVMIKPHPDAAKYQMDDYSEFDRNNIVWKYGK